MTLAEFRRVYPTAAFTVSSGKLFNLSLLSKSPGQSHAGPAHGRHWAVRPVL